MVRFNLATGSFSKDDGDISVESQLTNFQPYSRASTASITTDISIFNAQGDMQIQVEELTVSSLAPTKAEDDYELYLHTVLDLDPEFEIITTSPFSSTEPDRDLVESCERVARHFADQIRHTATLDTPPVSPMVTNLPDQEVSGGPILSPAPWEKGSEMGRFIQTSPYFSTLNFLCSVGKINPGALPNILSSAIQEAQQLMVFQKHLGRIVQQIVHRYPRMNILGLTDPNFTFTEHILQGLQDAYQSYTIGSGAEESLHNRLPSLQGNKKISFDYVNLNPGDEYGAVRRDLYDLVILSVSVCGNDTFSRVSALKTVRKLVKSGAFVILINTPRTPLERQSEVLLTPESTPQSPVTPSDWPYWLSSSAECGFISRSQNSDQQHPLGFSLSIRQADSSHMKDTFSPRACWWASEIVTENLLLIGGQTESVNKLSHELKILLTPNCKKISDVKSPSEIAPDVAASCTAIIILTDLEAPVCASMTESQLESLKTLVRPGMAILWVTSHARVDPEKAASFGLTRTLKAEMPSLMLQVLDLDEQEGSSTKVANDLCLLCHFAQYAQRDDSSTLLWSHEPEIHILNGKRWIPRVLPYKPAIERLNAYRRPVSTTVNTMETCIMLKPSQISDGAITYRAQNLGDAKSKYFEIDQVRLMYVECSSSYPVSIGHSKGMYVCIGRIAGQPGLLTAALSSEPASIVHVHHRLTHHLSTPNLDSSNFAFMLSQVLSAFELVGMACKENLVLVDPDQTFLRCVRILISDAFKEKKINLRVWSSDEKSCQDSLVLLIHPWSTLREVRSHLPDNCVVHDFLREGSQLTKTLGALSNHIQYHRGFGTRPLVDEAPRGDLTPSDNSIAVWNQALELSLHEMAIQPPKKDRSGVMTPSELLEATVHNHSFSIIDWKADRNLQIEVQPILKSQFLSSDRTYVLIGLTRDLGQSLCRLFIDHGARNMVVASRNPDMAPAWATELSSAGARVHISRLDVTILDDVKRFKEEIVSDGLGMPRVGGVVNGAMVLDDRVFAQMDIDTWTRVTRPKTVGSKNLDTVFDSQDLQFFIMTSSFAAIGGHGGQSNYAAANMYMNGLAMDRRRRGLVASVLNIGVIYGLGLLARERQHIYRGLEQEGYPPISERDIHHMFIEAIEAGRPVPGQIADLTTGLARYSVGDPNPLHWHRDQRFCHYTLRGNDDVHGQMIQQDGMQKQSIKDLLKLAQSAEAVSEIFQESLCRRVEIILQLPVNSVNGDSRVTEIGMDSLAAVEIRNWFYKSLEQDVPVLKILGASCISQRKHALVLHASCL